MDGHDVSTKSKGPPPPPAKEFREAGHEPGGSALSLPPVSRDLSMRSGFACVIAIVIVMVIWPRFADAVGIYVNAVGLAGLVAVGRTRVLSCDSSDINR